MYKVIRIRDKEFNALIDIGSQFNIVNQSSYNKVCAPALSNSTVSFSGFGGSKVKPIGCFKNVISIDGKRFPVVIYVVADDVMTMEAVIGNELLSQAEVNITGNSIVINKPCEINDVVSPNYVVELDLPAVGHVEKEKKEEVEDLLRNYVPKKSKKSSTEMSITVDNDQKIFVSPRRLPFAERKIVAEQVERIKEGIVEPCSSEYSSQVVVVRKKDGTPRVCIDYRAINRMIVKDRYPLPLIEDILDRLQDSRIFSLWILKMDFSMFQ